MIDFISAVNARIVKNSKEKSKNILREYIGKVTAILPQSKVKVRLTGAGVDYTFRNPSGLSLSVGSIVTVQSRGVNMINGKIVDRN